MKVQTSHS